MENKIIEIKNKKLENLIRTVLNKPTEPITKEDIIILKPMIKSLAKGNMLLDDHLCQNYKSFNNEIKKLALETGNEHMLQLYKRTDGNTDRRYQKFFGLCVLLGANDIYDIACGFSWQVGYIANLKGISYTGIDRSDGNNDRFIITIDGSKKIKSDMNTVDYDYYTSLFAKLNDNIRFVKAEYPFEIKAKPHNFAIAVGFNFLINGSGIAEALARDFERVIISVDFKDCQKFKEIFSGFHIMELCRSELKNYFTEKPTGDGFSIFFATRYGDDMEYLKSVGYNYYDDRFFVDTVDKTRYLENCRNV